MANIKTPRAILSYANGLFEARAASEGAEPRYSVSFVFPEGTDLSDLKRAAIQTAKEKWGDKLNGASLRVIQTQHGPANFLVANGLRIRLPWRDQPDDVAGKGYPEGATFMNARAPSPPGVVSLIPDSSNDNKPAVIVNMAGDVRMKDGTVVPGARPVYSGVIGVGLLSPFAYDTQGNRGVSFGLQGVQVIEDGERLDGHANAEDEFDADMEAAADLSDLIDEGESQEQDVAEPQAEGDDLSDLIG